MTLNLKNIAKLVQTIQLQICECVEHFLRVFDYVWCDCALMFWSWLVHVSNFVNLSLTVFLDMFKKFGFGGATTLWVVLISHILWLCESEIWVWGRLTSLSNLAAPSHNYWNIDIVNVSQLF